MARGRKKDLTIPPTRTLVQQRDYRARRALQITNLEERCRKAEEENVQLRKELAETREERLVNPTVLLPETAAASSELLHHLSSAKDALLKFNRLVFPNTQSNGEVTSTSSSDSATLASLSHTNPRSRKELYVDHPLTSPSSPTMFEDPSSSSGDCCGGMFDCDEFCGEEDNQSNITLTRTSDMRSTTA